MTEMSSCRPFRLLNFENAMDAAADGLATRRRILDDALEDYRAHCDVEYRAPTVDTPEVLRSFGGGLRDFGHWVGDVARAFEEAGRSGLVDISNMDASMTGDHGEIVYTASTEAIANRMPRGDDPFRGIPEGAGDLLMSGLGPNYDQDGPPSWIEFLNAGGTFADISSQLLKGTAEILEQLPQYASLNLSIEGSALVIHGDEALAAAFQAQLHARVRLPVAGASRLGTTARWLGRSGNALSAVAGGAGQWQTDAGLPMPQRVTRAVARGGATTLGSIGGSAVVVELASLAGVATACGPAAPLCVAGFGIVGAMVGAEAGNEFLENLVPSMDSPEPGEHDLDALSDNVASGGGRVDPALAAMADLGASDLARAAADADPEMQTAVERILPDEELLRRILETGSATPPNTTTGTTAPALPEYGEIPDPWIAERPYE